MESSSTKGIDFNIREQRYLTSCSLLTNLSTKHSDYERKNQLKQIRDEKEDMGRTYQLDRLLDRLASLLVAHGGGDCVAVTLGGLTNDKITLLASYATSGSVEGDNLLQEAAQKSGRTQPWTLEATVNLRAEKTRSTEEIKHHAEKIFGYLSSYHSTTDQQVRQDIDKDFSIQQMLYSINKIQSRYRILNGHLRKIRRVDLREYEHKAVERWEKDYYIPMPSRGDFQDESLAERLPQAFLDFERSGHMDGRRRQLKEYITTHPRMPTSVLSRYELIIWHELFLWLFRAVGQVIETCTAAKTARGSHDKGTNSYNRLKKCAEILDAFFQLIVTVVDGSCIFRRWAAILQKIVDGKGEKHARRDDTELLTIFPDAPQEQAAGSAQNPSIDPEEHDLEIEQGSQAVAGEQKQGTFRRIVGTIRGTFKRKKAADSQSRNRPNIDLTGGTLRHMFGKPVTWIKTGGRKREGLKEIIDPQALVATSEVNAGGQEESRETLKGGDAQKTTEDGDGGIALKTSTKALPIPGKQSESSLNEDAYEDDEEEDEDSFDMAITKVAKEAPETPLNTIFRLVYPLTDYQLIVRAVLQDRNIATQIRGRGFELQVVTAGRPQSLLKTERLEETLRRFFSVKSPKSNPLEIQSQIASFIHNLEKIITSKSRLQQVLDHQNEGHAVLAPQHAELLLLEHMVQQKTRSTYGYIGISKRPCFVCENVLYLRKPDIRTRKGHGHVYVSEIPKGLGANTIESVFDVVEELAKNITVQASPDEIKPKSSDTTYSHHAGIFRRETRSPAVGSLEDLREYGEIGTEERV
ncbi:hypothetical protein TWF106_004599 [Orbilia oligospora]|uniref:Uncharacterized protein n=1 Tax=Orbilia oligospora TaxID=2813651 RepID=A0A7C8UHF7_ORBOL|nr:hypothetical protein TWF106_004599 [Orbilia oligospora]